MGCGINKTRKHDLITSNKTDALFTIVKPPVIPMSGIITSVKKSYNNEPSAAIVEVPQENLKVHDPRSLYTVLEAAPNPNQELIEEVKSSKTLVPLKHIDSPKLSEKSIKFDFVKRPEKKKAITHKQPVIENHSLIEEEIF